MRDLAEIQHAAAYTHAAWQACLEAGHDEVAQQIEPVAGTLKWVLDISHGNSFSRFIARVTTLMDQFVAEHRDNQ